ncbi:amino acid transporter AVT1J-like [Penaeus chinensis]|uniref:amino acid transporter AVT1J-like n=1 Tax=Penaeus chinensis TaxID=139456 RepID=UPI001FB80A83|nr:amino acid transporter AVT1J-like [Penaeus chinensis]
MNFEENEKIYSKQANYAATNGSAESPAASAESAISWAPEVSSGEGRARKGLTMMVGAMFLVGEMAGAGVLNLPKAMANTGWVGVPLTIVLCAGVGYSGTRLAECWVLLEERWPEYRVPCRRPYPAIAYRALGTAGQYVAEFALNLTLFGASTVFLLLATQMIHSITASLINLTACEWTLIVGAVLTPLTWMGTPKDFWPASILAMAATFLACLVVMVKVVLQADASGPPLYTAPTFGSFFLGFGSILFALGGASIFPTVQNDMRDRAQFSSSVIVAFLTLLVLYLPLMTICYGVLGSEVKDNILMNVSGVVVTLVNALIFVHFVFALTIVVNPVMQTLEGIFNLPNRFSPKRCALRSCIMAVIILMGLAVPDFGKILDLIGGSSVTLMSFILPPLCYIRLCNAELTEGVKHRDLARWERVLLIAIVVVGCVGGVASSYSALREILSPQAFSFTCFSRRVFLK